MKKEEALQDISYLESFIGKKVYTINGGDFTIHSFYADLQAGSQNQFEVYVRLIPGLETISGQLKTETFNLFRSTYSVMETIALKVEIIEDVKRLSLLIPDEFEYDSVQFSAVGNKHFPQKSIASFPTNFQGMKCEIFEISNDLKKFTKAESGRIWASIQSNGINYLSNPLSFARINSL